MGIFGRNNLMLFNQYQSNTLNATDFYYKVHCGVYLYIDYVCCPEFCGIKSDMEQSFQT